VRSNRRRLDTRPFFRKSRAVAANGNQWQIATRRVRLNHAKTVAAGCGRLPRQCHGKEEVRLVCRRRHLQAKHLLGRYPGTNSFPKALVRCQLRAGASPGAPGRKSLQLSIFLTIFKPVRRGSPTLGRFDSCAAPLRKPDPKRSVNAFGSPESALTQPVFQICATFLSFFGRVLVVGPSVPTSLNGGVSSWSDWRTNGARTLNADVSIAASLNVTPSILGGGKLALCPEADVLPDVLPEPRVRIPRMKARRSCRAVPTPLRTSTSMVWVERARRPRSAPRCRRVPGRSPRDA
jgi:hypothetical protein